MGVRGWLPAAMTVLLTALPAFGQERVDLPAEDRRLSADFPEAYRIGSFDGDTWETFGEIAGTAFDGAGNLYVLDRQASRITVVDRDGAFVREIGRAGEGPGEFRMPMAFTVMADGRVVVADLGHRAYQLFAPSGAFERMVSMGDGDVIRLGDMAPVPGANAVLSGGSGNVVAMRGGPGGGGAAAAEPPGRPIERIDLGGRTAVATTITRAWQAPRESAGPERLQGGGMSFSVSMASPRTWEPDLLMGALPDGGVAYADSSTWSVKVLGPSGSVQRVLRRPFRPRPVTPRMQEDERARRLAELDAGEGPRMRMMVQGPGGGAAQAVSPDAMNEMMRGRIAQMQFYHELPVLMALRTSWSGKIWAQRRGDAPTEPGPIDVLTADGRYAGTFPQGATAMPNAFGPDGLAAWVERDDFDVPVVVVRRLPPVLN